MQVKFGKEVLVLDTWARRIQYDSLCNILGPGINAHLTENDLLRDIFELLDPPPTNEIPAHAQHQMERNRKVLNYFINNESTYMFLFIFRNIFSYLKKTLSGWSYFVVMVPTFF